MYVGFVFLDSTCTPHVPAGCVVCSILAAHLPLIRQFDYLRVRQLYILLTLLCVGSFLLRVRLLQYCKRRLCQAKNTSLEPELSQFLLLKMLSYILTSLQVASRRLTVTPLSCVPKEVLEVRSRRYY